MGVMLANPCHPYIQRGYRPFVIIQYTSAWEVMPHPPSSPPPLPLPLQIPSLVLGPFGCGKTRTLRECIMLLSFLPDTTILICTHSNSAANIYVQELHGEYTSECPATCDNTGLCLLSEQGHEAVSMLRIYYTGRRLDTIPYQIRPYCRSVDITVSGIICIYCLSRIDNGRLVLPSLSELKQYRIIVVTLSTSRCLSLMGLPRGHFTHIFIDEAAQVSSHSHPSWCLYSIP